MENEQLIHDYTNDRLIPEERLAFELRLETDAQLAQEYEQYVDLKKAIKEQVRIDLKDTLRALENQKEEISGISDEQTVSFSKKYSYIYIAAAVIIFAVIGFQFLEQDPSNQDLYASFYQPYDNTLQPVTRGETTEDVLSQAFQAYEAADFEKAIPYFNSSLEEQYQPDVAFYKAMSLMSSGQDMEASQVLNNLKKQKSSYEPQVYWYSALLSLKNNQEQRAKEQLDSLSMLNSGYKNSALAKIKKELTD